MSAQWPKRMRDTARLIRVIAEHTVIRNRPTPDQLYGLCKLTWITSSFDGDNPAYVRSTKIPGLGDALRGDFGNLDLPGVAAEVARLLGTPQSRSMVLKHTGFTDLYKAYRNVARVWVADNAARLRLMFRAAYNLQSDEQGLQLARQIQQLPRIRLAAGSTRAMRPEYLLTPIFACLDPRGRFPLINGNKGVQHVLSQLRVKTAPLERQYQTMLTMYGQGGVRDWADLDHVGRSGDLQYLIHLKGRAPTMKTLGMQSLVDTRLALKDASDLEAIHKARATSMIRLHNHMTNRLKAFWEPSYQLREGLRNEVMFDVLIRNFDARGRDLLIEVKSIADEPNVRMAIGQLDAYTYALGLKRDQPRAVLLPCKPEQHIIELLQWREVGLLWFDGEVSLKTDTPWLKHLVV